jgi:hypothetical protein
MKKEMKKMEKAMTQDTKWTRGEVGKMNYLSERAAFLVSLPRTASVLESFSDPNVNAIS